MIFLKTKLTTENTLTDNGILVYTALASIRPTTEYKNQIAYINTDNICFELGLDYGRRTQQRIQKGIQELIDKNVIILVRHLGGNRYIFDLSSLKTNTKKDYFIGVYRKDIDKILQSQELLSKRISLLIYWYNIISTFDNSKEKAQKRGKIGYMSQKYISKLTGLSSDTIERYNKILEEMKIMYVYRSEKYMQAFPYGNAVYSISNTYSAYMDKEACIAAGKLRESEYGSEHKLIKSRKSRQESNKNRKLAQMYNALCNGFEYSESEIEEIYNYVLKKNSEYQAELDKKMGQSNLSPSEQKYIRQLELRLRDTSVFEKYEFLH